MLKATIGNGVDVNATTCKEVMEMDVLKVALSDSIADVIKSVTMNVYTSCGHGR